MKSGTMRSGSMTARQPFFQKVLMPALREPWGQRWQTESLDLLFWEVFWFLGRGEITMQDSIIHDMEYYPVSTFVNSVKNNDPNCIKPVEL